MFKAFEFCIPIAGTKVPAGPEWLHEIKYDGFRLCVERDGDRVRLFTRGGYDWTKRYPWIVEAAPQQPLARRRAQNRDARRGQRRSGGSMKFVEREHCAHPDVAARKLVEIANGVEPMQDGRRGAQGHEEVSSRQINRIGRGSGRGMRLRRAW